MADLIDIVTVGSSHHNPYTQRDLQQLLKPNFQTQKIFVAISDATSTRIFDFKTKELLHTIAETSKYFMFVSDHEFVYANQNKITVFNMMTKQSTLCNVGIEKANVRALTFVNRVVIANFQRAQHNIVQWNLDSFEHSVTPVDCYVGGIVPLNSTNVLIVHDDTKISKMDLVTLQLEEFLTLSHPVDSVQKLGETRILALTQDDVQVWDTDKKECIWKRHIEETVLKLLPISATLFATELHKRGAKIYLWNTATTEKDEIPNTARPTNFAGFDCSATKHGLLFFLDVDYHLTVIDLRNNTVVQKFDEKLQNPCCAVW
jgi:hypothetical protein